MQLIAVVMHAALVAHNDVSDSRQEFALESCDKEHHSCATYTGAITTVDSELQLRSRATSMHIDFSQPHTK